MFYEDFFRKLNEVGVKYIIVGGLAAIIHGSPRYTHDIDLVIKMDDENIRKFMKLLEQYNYQPKIPINLMDFTDASKREQWIKEKNMKAFHLQTPAQLEPDIDILIKGPDYEELNSEIYQMKDVDLPVATIDALIRMKKQAGRDVDQIDVQYLKQVKEEKNK